MTFIMSPLEGRLGCYVGYLVVLWFYIVTPCEATQPNIVFVLADDLGWNDVGYHGSGIYTPNIDKLAGQGVKLENYYVQPICSPSRSQLLSGRYQIHTGLQHSVISPGQANGLPLEMPTIADLLRKVGYSNHIVGKWHIGFYKKEYTPTYRGFDSHYGFLTGGEDHWSHVRCFNGSCGKDLRKNLEVDWGKNGTFSGDLMTSQAIQVIENHSQESDKTINDTFSTILQQPLFLYLPYQLVHIPNQVPTGFVKRYSHIKDKKRRLHAAMVSCLDEGVGNITEALRESGLWNNTVFIFSTDNGGQTKGGGNNWPLRGRKVTLWEGGLRGVGFVHSPLLPPSRRGVNETQLLHISDWLPTLVGLAGGDTSGLDLDGFNNWNVIGKGLPSNRKEILHNIDPLQPPVGKRVADSPFDNRIRAAIRSGHWKLITGDPGFGKWVPPPSDPEEEVVYPDEEEEAYFKTYNPEPSHFSINAKNLWLFDVNKDPQERNDVSDKYPSVVKELLGKLAAYNATAVPCRYPLLDDRSKPEYNGGAWGPWL